MTGPVWLHRRLSESPEPLRRGLEEEIGRLEPGEDIPDALLAAACRVLDGARAGLDRREAAIDLLVADGLLTLACEASARSDPGRLEERCRDMGPGGELGRLARRWTGRS